MPRPKIPSHVFVFVVVEHEGHVLLVRERKHGQLWYAPAGGLEPGESIAEAAVRETLEESGVRVEPIGIVRVEQQWFPSDQGVVAWWRFIVRARPVGALAPKTEPDEHTLEARWVPRDRIQDLPLRHREVIDIVELARHAPMAPIETLPVSQSA